MPRAPLIAGIAVLAVGLVLAVPALALPDAAIARIDAAGSDLHEGDQVPITVEIVNRGDSPLPPVPVVLNLNEKQYAEWKLPSTLAPGAGATWSLTWPAVRGSVVMLATVDPLNDVIESDESNNSSFISLGVGEARPPSPWPPALAGLGAFLLGLLIAVLFQRLRPRPRPDQRYALRRPARGAAGSAGVSPATPGEARPPGEPQP